MRSVGLSTVPRCGFADAFLGVSERSALLPSVSVFKPWPSEDAVFSLSEDYPNGTWLGDENNPEMRVRCAIIPSDMLHISTNCRTAEKMALTLLDYLFHREVQAVSNLSGQGKHGKKQLDPLTIYGIRCKTRVS
ncbi:hypothetical protein P7K49_036954 [Saguinus oedipus]|uniref:Protein BANP n=1 Tax=Saguinus oedipus TaxID=9490 RepID=A0ABQ9TLL3_SAGOE|nr:hypothetical protein P7K49_036954 [Saguinus oedipus]